jgi:hypothetical protein
MNCSGYRFYVYYRKILIKYEDFDFGHYGHAW